MIRAIIIEDESKAQELLAGILEEFCPEIALVGMAKSPGEALSLIETSNPDLVFMDINLKDGNAFDILDPLESKTFKTIFTTAYDEYALKAFNYEAVDYILKPYSPKEVKKAVERVKKAPPFNILMTELSNVIIEEKYNKGKLSISTSKSLEIVPFKEIVMVKGERSYCSVYLLDGRDFFISKPMKEVENQLPTLKFFRTHQSYVINLDHVKRFNKEDGGLILMVNGLEIPVSRAKKQEFLDILTN